MGKDTVVYPDKEILSISEKKCYLDMNVILSKKPTCKGCILYDSDY